jgi:hypothetical protein
MIRNPWVVGVFTSLMASVITAWAAKMVPADGISPLWQKYWPEILGVVVGVLWLGGYWLWLRSRRLADRFGTLARQASDSHIETVVYKILDNPSPRLLSRNPKGLEPERLELGWVDELRLRRERTAARA